MQCHQHRDPPKRSGEVGPEFMFQLMVLLLSVIVGIHYGDRFGSDYGILARIVGWLLGPVIVTLLAFGAWLLLYQVIVDPIDRLLKWLIAHWKPDRADAVIAVPASSADDTAPAEITIPTGMVTTMVTLFAMGFSLALVWSDSPMHEMAYPFVATCTLAALITGIVVEWRMSRSESKSDAARDDG